MRGVILACGLVAMMLAPVWAARTTLTVAVDRSSEPAADLVQLSDLVKKTYDSQRRWFDVHSTLQGVEAVVGDTEKDKDIVAALDKTLADVPNLALTKTTARAFWLKRTGDPSETWEQSQKHFGRLEDYIMRLRPPLPGVTIEAVADGAVIHSEAPDFETTLQKTLLFGLMEVRLLSPGVWHVAWRSGDDAKAIGKYPIDKMVAFVLHEPLDLNVEPIREGAVFVVDDDPRAADFIAAVRNAFATDRPYTLRETPALRVAIEPKSGQDGDDMLPGATSFRLLKDIDEAVNPSIEATVFGDHVRVRATNSALTVERTAIVRTLLEGRSDLVITTRKDHALEIRLKPGAHLFAPKPTVNDARLVAVIKTRVAALKLEPISVVTTGPEHATVTFVSNADAAAFRRSVTLGTRLTLRLVDVVASDSGKRPLPGATKLPAKDGHALWLKPGVILNGSMVASAKAETSDATGQIGVAIRLTDEGRKLFAAVTRAHLGERLAIVVDDVVMTAPTIIEPIEGGQLQVTGAFSMEEAQALAAAIMPQQADLPLRIVH